MVRSFVTQHLRPTKLASVYGALGASEMSLKAWIEKYLRQGYADFLRRKVLIQGRGVINYTPETKGGYHIPEHHHASIILDDLFEDMEEGDLE